MAKSKRRRARKRGPAGSASGDSGGRRRAGAPEPPRLERKLQREIEREAAQIARRAQEARDPQTPPERVAELLLAEFEQIPAPVGFAQTLAGDGSSDRPGAVLAELERLAPDSVTTLTFAAEVARIIDGEPQRAGELLERAIEAEIDPDMVAALAEHLREAGEPVQALRLVEGQLAEDPDDELAQEVYAATMQSLHGRAAASERLSREEQKALSAFSARSLMYELRDGLRSFIDERPELGLLVAKSTAEWQEELPVSLLEPAGEGLLRLAIESAWMLNQDDDDEVDLDEDWDEDWDEDAEHEPPSSPLALFAADDGSRARLAKAARSWSGTCVYGLWQLSDPDPAPGVWLTNILTGVRHYTAIPPEQIELANRWTVLLGGAGGDRWAVAEHRYGAPAAPRRGGRGRGARSRADRRPRRGYD
ncbi:MAG: tetratricopeptide repeat protein [Solirubrobacteraceae bacterium]